MMSVAVFLSGAIPVSAADESKDPFAAGSTWIGDVRVAGREGVGHAGLTISERMGESFKGEFVIRGPMGKMITLEVSGTATNKASGPLIFETKKEGISQLKMRGKLNNNAATVSFVGTSPFGAKGVGAIVLKPKI